MYQRKYPELSSKVVLGGLLFFILFCLYGYFEAKSNARTAQQTADSALENLGQLERRFDNEVHSVTIELMKQWSKSEKTPSHSYPPVPSLPASVAKRILVTGGAGFVGSNLVDVLMLLGHHVIVVDNLFTGRKQNIDHWLGHPHFEFRRHDIVDPLHVEVDQIYHLACPASPPHYMYNPIKTIKTSTVGTINMLGLAKRLKARLLFTSTSEVYGDPEEHPQKESYWGHVNPIGPRACYDEGKRVAETMCYAYQSEEGVDVRVARIFNTYGPRMHPHDGRVVSNFIIQSLSNQPMTIYGDGSQTRSFQYVSDLVKGLILLMESDLDKPCNLGNPVETTIKEFAEKIRSLVNPSAEIKQLPANEDDPRKRKPDISRAKEHLGWEPAVKIDDGLKLAVEYFKTQVKDLALNYTDSDAGGGESSAASESAKGRIWIAELVHDPLIRKAFFNGKREQAGGGGGGGGGSKPSKNGSRDTYRRVKPSGGR